MAGFADLLQSLEALDFFVGVIPFILTFAIFFVVLSNAPKFKESDGITALVSASFGLLASFFILSNPYYANFLINYLGFLTIGILAVVGIISALLLTGFKDWLGLGPESDKHPGLQVAVGGLAVAVVAVSFVSAGGLGPGSLGGTFGYLSAAAGFLVSTGLVWIVLLAAVIGIALEAAPDDENGN